MCDNYRINFSIQNVHKRENKLHRLIIMNINFSNNNIKKKKKMYSKLQNSYREEEKKKVRQLIDNLRQYNPRGRRV